MPFWRKSLFLLLFLQQIAVAQSILMIEDQTETGFKLVMNTFIQNETALPKLNLQKFPAKENEILILLNDGQQLKRKLPQFKEGIHKYVIYRDYSGKTRMRYRGIHDQLSQSALMFDYKEELPWQDGLPILVAERDTSSQFESWKKQNALKDSLNKLTSATIKSSEAEPIVAALDTASQGPPKTKTIIEASLELQSQKPEIVEKGDSNVVLNPAQISPQDSSNLVKVIAVDTSLASLKPITQAALKPDSVQKPSVSKPGDSLLLAPSEQSAMAEKPNAAALVDPYLKFSSSYLKSTFEFDKLQMAKTYAQEHEWKKEELIEVLKNLKYDQSRLDLLNFSLNSQAALKANKEELLSCLDYDLSKQQAEKLFD